MTVTRDFYVVLTMDCEPALFECSPLAIKLSGSGPSDYEEGARSIRGYFETAADLGYPVTFFAHPEVAVAQSGLLLELQREGACLGGCTSIRTSCEVAAIVETWGLIERTSNPS